MIIGSLVKPLVCIGLITLMLADAYYIRKETESPLYRLLPTILKRQTQLPPEPIPTPFWISSNKPVDQMRQAYSQYPPNTQQALRKRMSRDQMGMLDMIINLKELENEYKQELSNEQNAV